MWLSDFRKGFAEKKSFMDWFFSLPDQKILRLINIASDDMWPNSLCLLENFNCYRVPPPPSCPPSISLFLHPKFCFFYKFPFCSLFKFSLQQIVLYYTVFYNCTQLINNSTCENQTSQNKGNHSFNDTSIEILIFFILKY